jgi:hypothetical protein
MDLEVLEDRRKTMIERRRLPSVPMYVRLIAWLLILGAIATILGEFL